MTATRPGTVTRLRAPTRLELDRLVPLATAAEWLSVSTRTLHRLIARGHLRAVKIGHGRGVWRVPESELARVTTEGTRLE